MKFKPEEEGFNTLSLPTPHHHSIKILSDAYEIIKHKYQWCQGNRFQTMSGTAVKAVEKDGSNIGSIYKYSLDGAIQMAYARIMKSQKNLGVEFKVWPIDLNTANETLCKVIHCTIPEWNDDPSTTHQDVLNALMATIETLSKEEAEMEEEDKIFETLSKSKGVIALPSPGYV